MAGGQEADLVLAGGKIRTPAHPSGFAEALAVRNGTILAVGTGEERAVVRNGKIVAAHIMSVTLACDHRAIDGALGAVLISAFKALIENPVMMLV